MPLSRPRKYMILCNIAKSIGDCRISKSLIVTARGAFYIHSVTFNKEEEHDKLWLRF